MLNLNEIKDTVRETVATVIDQEASGIDDAAQLGVDLAVDSLTLTEIALKLESKFDIRFANEDYVTLKSVNEIAQRIVQLIPADVTVTTSVAE
jgi:acyl carrier protein